MAATALDPARTGTSPGLPPGPAGGLIGQLKILRWSMRDPFGALDDLVARHGDPFTLPTLDVPLVITGQPEAVEAIFACPTERMESISPEGLRPVLGEGSVLMLSGEPHRNARKLMTPPFHGARMRAYAQVMAGSTRERAAEIRTGQPFTMMELAQHISLDVILKAVFGVTEPARVQQVRRRVLDVVGLSPLLVGLRFLQRRFGGLGPWARFLRQRADLEAVVAEEIAERRGRTEPGQDILSLLLCARYEDGTPMTDAHVTDQLLTLVAAGHETTGIMLAWAFYLLHRNPGALERLQAELEPAGTPPDPEALMRLPFLEAVLHETLRLYPGAAAFSRRLRAPLSLGGHEIPAGVAVGACPYLAHRRPEVFPEPGEFRPERFLGRSYAPNLYFPFGGGIRRCLGSAFAMVEMKIVLGVLLSSYRFELLEPAPVPARARLATLGPRTGIRMTLQPRATA
jgi:cytochrome P450